MIDFDNLLRSNFWKLNASIDGSPRAAFEGVNGLIGNALSAECGD
jgi:hypothetical protein